VIAALLAADVWVAQNVFFYVIAAAMVFAAFRVVSTDNIVHAALYLVVVLAGGAAQYLLLAQEFVAWVQVIVYIGAVIVLFLFGIMLTRAPMRAEEKLNNDLRGWATVPTLLLAGIIGALCLKAFGDDMVAIESPTRTGAVTNAVFRQYLVPFEVVGVLLLAALIGAVVLARRD
jgi:NADH-quinone oxidoreductase subunit J